MIVRFEPSGTWVKPRTKQLQLRFDLYPEVGSPLYGLYNVEHFDEKGKSLGRWLNPCYGHFIKVPETVLTDDVLGYLANVLFDKDTLAAIAAYITRPDAAHYIGPMMRAKPKFTLEKVITGDWADLIAARKAQFDGLEIVLPESPTAPKLEHGQIDIGPGATDRGSSLGSTTIVDQANPANDNGSITTWELYFATNAANVEVATFIDEGSNTLSTRDTETIGAVAAGSKYSSGGFNTDVATGDLAGMARTSGNIEADTSGGTGLYYLGSDQIPCSSVTFAVLSGYVESIYGEGGAAGWTHKYQGVANANIGKIMGVAKASIGKVDGVS